MTDSELGPLRVAIVGAGRLGIAIGRALQRADLPLVAASSRSAEGQHRASRELQVPVFDDAALAIEGADLVVVCVPDDAIASVAATIVPAVAPDAPPRVVHTSGCVPLDALHELRKVGCDVLSVHPMQTVTHAPHPNPLQGSPAAVTAYDEPTRTFGHALAHTLQMVPFDLADEAKPLYHAACSFAANFTVAVLASVRDLAAAAGMDPNVSRHAFCTLARAAVDRVEREGPESALTGPILRADRATIASHLAALDEAHPADARLYRALATATVAVAVDAGLDVESAAMLEQLLATDQPLLPGDV